VLVEKVAMSGNYYDSIAEEYGDISFKRIRYLLAVEKFVLTRVKEVGPKNLLDVGSGDGKRLARILEQHQFEIVTAVEPSINMFRKLEKLNLDIELQNSTIENFDTEEKYDLILCLWNVIGHIDDLDKFLLCIRTFLKPGGTVIIDFNNKFNIKQYGLQNVLKNLLSAIGVGSQNRQRGVFPLDEVNFVKVWSRYEFINASKKYFKNHQYKYINYQSGKIERFLLAGQVVVCMESK
jgi:2-polyprenyl-3-methyl-5-hydroxy-6-metoxy-1,4-benzoquinol methylase